jgi:transposase InsO family protein
MAQKVIAMEAKLRAVFEGDLGGLRVTDLCAEVGMSRQTFYKYRRRWLAEGPPGLVERSRRPRRSPGLIAPALEDEIVRLRKELPLDNGAQTIAYHLARAGWAVPSVSTIHRALVRRGLVVAQPKKRPRSAWRRFEWPLANDAWQIDATRWVLRNRREIWVMDILDDHSRVAVAARACTGPTGEAAWSALCDGASRWGLPARVMSDNGVCFTVRFQSDRPTEFERDLRRLGIHHIPSSPAHPQTCGKIERFHQTLKRWLRTQPLARTPAELQDQLDTFITFYNEHRPHRALHGLTPHERWTTSDRAAPTTPLPEPPDAGLYLVSTRGAIGWGRYDIGIGKHLAGERLLVIARGHDLAIFTRTGLVRRLKIDPNRDYQPTGRPGGPRRNSNPHH